MRIRITLAVLVLAIAVTAIPAHATRIKDIASIDGVRSNQLIGFGLVGGLAGTGDDPKRAIYTAKAISRMLSRFVGYEVPAESIRIKNFASVAVTADLPAYYKPGDRLDVTVSSIGSAKSIEGGVLYRTLLMGLDGNIYAVAQGLVSMGDFVGRKKSGGGKGHLTVGRIVGGATVEREIPSTVVKDDGTIRINLHNPDFTTAESISLKIQTLYGYGAAKALDGGTVTVKVPEFFRYNIVPFIAALETLEVFSDSRARVVINQRTGTIVMGGEVEILPVAVAHGSLSITIGPGGRLVAEENGGEGIEISAQVELTEAGGEGEISLTRKETFVRVNAKDVVEGLNALGVTPSDIVAIFEVLAAAGALQGTLEII